MGFIQGTKAFHRKVVYGCGCEGVDSRDNAESINCPKCAGTEWHSSDDYYRALSRKVAGVGVDFAGNVIGWHSERDRNFARACGE